MASPAVAENFEEMDCDAGASTRVAFKRLSLQNFRSYEKATFDFSEKFVVLTGRNGAGKTNILEALSLLGPGRGLRSARLDEMPRLGGNGAWAVSAKIGDEFEQASIGVGVQADNPDRRACRVDGQNVSGPSAFAEHIRMIWLTPASDRLFLEGASVRRRFLDRMTLAHDASHGKTASAFEKAMRQRQKLLEDRSTDAAWLEALEIQMAETGVAVAASRREMAATLAASKIDTGGSFPSAGIALEGELETALSNLPAAEVEENYIKKLRDTRGLDTKAGRALSGPHRSDLLVTHRDKKQPAKLCSTGEQKALLLGLVLANALALSARPGGAALVLLFDEVAAHLDEQRREALFNVLDTTNFQSFVTGTDRSLFEGWCRHTQNFAVDSGTAERT